MVRPTCQFVSHYSAKYSNAMVSNRGLEHTRDANWVASAPKSLHTCIILSWCNAYLLNLKTNTACRLPSIGCPFQSQTKVASGMAKGKQLKETESPSVTLTSRGPSDSRLKMGTPERHNLHKIYIDKYGKD